ncbi:hypothetical protein G6F31_020807 [Rhizopus arrhizus]|nr:hypothetical protein G6F31_020807 [Rhizopus arrhizus]
MLSRTQNSCMSTPRVAAEVMPRRGDITAGRELAPVDLVAGFLQCGIETAVRDGGQERAHDQLISDHQLGLGISGCGQQRGGQAGKGAAADVAEYRVHGGLREGSAAPRRGRLAGCQFARMGPER